MRLAESFPVTPARQAQRILAAWNAGNEPLLQQELQISQQLRGEAGPGGDEERLELLRAVSAGMLRLSLPLLGTRKDPAVRRCLDLLAHLAGTPAVPPSPYVN